MNNKLEIHTYCYQVIDSNGATQTYCGVSSVTIEDGRLIVRGSEHVLGSFSSWQSSTGIPDPQPIECKKANEGDDIYLRDDVTPAEIMSREDVLQRKYNAIWSLQAGRCSKEIGFHEYHKGMKELGL